MELTSLTAMGVFLNILVTIGGGIKIYIDMRERMTRIETIQEVHGKEINSLRKRRYTDGPAGS